MYLNKHLTRTRLGVLDFVQREHGWKTLFMKLDGLHAANTSKEGGACWEPGC